MEPEAKYTLVGAVICALATGLVLAILWLARSGSSDASRLYIAYFRKHSLAGLTDGAEVTMKGIRVGAVRSTRITPSDVGRVEAVLEVDKYLPVKEDTRAVVERSLLTGLASVELTSGTLESKPLEKKEGERFPIIQEGAPRLEQLQASLPVLLENADRLIRNAADLLNDDNRKSVEQTLKNLEKVSTTLAERDEQITQGIQKASDAVSSLGHEVDVRLKELSHSLKSSSGSIALEFSLLVRQFNDTLQLFSTTMQRFRDPRALILGPSKEELGPGEGRTESK